MSASFWNGKRVLITGDTGFKGAWLSYILNTYGSIVQGVSSSEFHQNTHLYSSLNLNKITNTIDCDIRNGDEIKRIFSSFNPEIVFHLAAQPLVRHSYTDPLLTYETNVIGTLIILEAIKESNSVQAAVMVTTDKCYENHEWDWGYRENDPLGGHDPYSSSKACAELLIRSYQHSFFNEVKSFPGISSVRAGNVIGGGDFSEDRLIPDLFRAIQNNSKISLRNPLATRPWQHVFEPLSGYMEVGQRLFESGSSENDCWNFGPNNRDIRTVNEIVELFSSSWGIKNIAEIDSITQPHEAKSLSLDISKAQFQLGWFPKWDLENAIEKTVNWYKGYLNNDDLRSLSSFQIEDFFKN
jgi:CDP-glucose 4,6-dehydratase